LTFLPLIQPQPRLVPQPPGLLMFLPPIQRQPLLMPQLPAPSMCL
jgi:hypothetical protein